MLFKIFSLYLIFLLCLLIRPHQTGTSKDKHDDSKPVEKYRSPGTVRYPIGDEELNNNIFDSVGINEALERHERLNEFGVKCRNVPKLFECVNPHVRCESDRPVEVIYSSDAADISPEVQCRKCDLKVTNDGKAVIVKCFDCLDIPSTKNAEAYDVLYLVYYVSIANYTSRT